MKRGRSRGKENATDEEVRGNARGRETVRVAMIKSSLPVDLPRVPFERERERRGEVELAVRVRLASFYALCLRPLGSYLTDVPPFIFDSIDSSSPPLDRAT